jgi:hypothetical protein
MRISRCPGCGASLPPAEDTCDYCGQHIQYQNQEPTFVENSASTLLFRRVNEPKEGAFSLVIPAGWQLEGGIQRLGGLSAQTIEAKLDFCIKRDHQGTVRLRWCPDTKFCDLRGSMAAMMFPPGSNYQGMTVCPVMPAEEFLVRVAFPYVQPHITDFSVLEKGPMPTLVDRYQKKMAALGLPTPFSYQGGGVAFKYTEQGVEYIEKGFAVIEDMGPIAAGMWSNKDTVLVRAPAAEFPSWEKVFLTIFDSTRINLEWLAQEARNQGVLSQSFLNAQQQAQAREQRMLAMQREGQRLDREMEASRMQATAEVADTQYKSLMGLEEYYNPYTEERELGSNQWDHRWVNLDGDVIYTDRADIDPNLYESLNRTDWERSPIVAARR